MSNLAIFEALSIDCSKSVTKKYSTSFYTAVNQLHVDLHRPIHSIYGFVRLADEIVDTFHAFEKRNLLDSFQVDTMRAIEKKISINPVLNSFQWVVNEYGIKKEYIEAFFNSMYADLEQKEWQTAAELKEYIYGSAEVVGLMCLQVFCAGDQQRVERLKPAAEALGSAFQKINFLRDLKEDMDQLGRKYFKDVDFKNFDLETKRKIEKEIDDEFTKAYQGIKNLPPKAKFGVLLAYKYYYCLFQKIQKLAPHQVMEKRIRVDNMQKMLLLVKLKVRNTLNLVD
ncbi:phytoene/squalene synthase family protein [Sphingobacteriaceae bacterium WQ 2009]|uniref:Phytoene/squalene synthase family protein n=1 Tax=Rhinopithecimicrobium faecis TaxID=2820698 RepID=A0A8T4H7F7_9SPHI|nr:phytoene/squalene synthase family protein [Sphingobacteriaceae bacterium WQ 2009]